MNKALFGFFILISTLAFGQKNILKEEIYTYQLNYQFNYIKDSLNTNDLRSEDFVLYVDKQQNSYFLPTKLLEIDYVLAEVEKTNQMIQLPLSQTIQLPTSYSKWRVFKRTSGESFFVDMLGKNTFKYVMDDDINFSWTITDEEKEILGYKATKAVTKAYGRLWEAWFTKEIPLNNGPYKFSGLTGLILQLSDSANFFTFKIVSFQKGAYTMIYSPKVFESTLLQKTDFIRASKNYAENIIEELKQQGIYPSPQTESMILENVQRNNNFLERP